MTPGTILFDKDFKFFDGESAPKLLVLNDGGCGYYVVVKLTSQRHEKSVVAGCQPRDRFQNFYLPQGSCGLSKSSWVMLYEFYEFDPHDLAHLKVIGNLNEPTTKTLLVCAIESLDISDRHAQMLDECLTLLALG
jgi:hypothetical protein